MEETFRELVADLAELSVTIGLMNSVIEQYPEHVQENWAERVRGIREWANNQAVEIQQFAEAFDDQPASGQMEDESPQ